MRWIALLLAALLSSCGSNDKSPHGSIRIGIDSTWAPIDFQQQQPYINGYVENLLLEISRYSGVQFEKIPANWDSIFQDLSEGRYDAVITSINPYEFNLAKYDFSENILDLGPVLVTASTSKLSKLEEFSGELIGIVNNSPAVLLLEQHPGILIRLYSSIPEMLDAVASGQIQGALVNQLSAANYTRNLYAGHLQIASMPFTTEGLHAVSLKNNGRFIKAFNNSIEQLKKKKTVADLQKKWNLS